LRVYSHPIVSAISENAEKLQMGEQVQSGSNATLNTFCEF